MNVPCVCRGDRIIEKARRRRRISRRLRVGQDRCLKYFEGEVRGLLVFSCMDWKLNNAKVRSRKEEATAGRECIRSSCQMVLYKGKISSKRQHPCSYASLCEVIHTLHPSESAPLGCAIREVSGSSFGEGCDSSPHKVINIVQEDLVTIVNFSPPDSGPLTEALCSTFLIINESPRG